MDGTSTFAPASSQTTWVADLHLHLVISDAKTPLEARAQLREILVGLFGDDPVDMFALNRQTATHSPTPAPLALTG